MRNRVIGNKAGISGFLALAMVCTPAFAETVQVPDVPDTVNYNGRQIRVYTPVNEVEQFPIQIPRVDLPMRVREAGPEEFIALTAPLNPFSVGLTPAAQVLRAPVGDSSGLRDFENVYYAQPNAQFFTGGALEKAGFALDLQAPNSGVPLLTEIEITSVVNAEAVGSPPINVAAYLVEAYDNYTEDDMTSANAPVHSSYLGGIVLTFGCVQPANQTGTLLFDATNGGAEPDDYFFQASGLDDQMFFTYQAVEFNTNGPGDPSDDTISLLPGGTIVWVYGRGESFEPTAGSSPDGGAWYLDGFGAGNNATDRIMQENDGPVSFGGLGDTYVAFSLRGRQGNDCNNNGVFDDEEVACGISVSDCSTGGLCVAFNDPSPPALFRDPFMRGRIVAAVCDDAPSNGVPDACDTADCDTNGTIDALEIAGDPGLDCNGDTILDKCQIDMSSTAPGGPFFCNPATVSCDPDCNNNGIPDECDISGCAGPGLPCSDCNADEVPDGCEIADGSEPDCDENGVLDRCERPLLFDCNRNGQEDFCDIFQGLVNDINNDAVPDICGSTSTVQRWNGFEGPEFTVGTDLQFFDSDGDGDTWGGVNSADFPAGVVEQAGGPIFATACEGNRMACALANYPVFLSTELFFPEPDGSVPDPAQVMELKFQVSLHGARASDRDFQIFTVDGTGDQTANLLWFPSQGSTVDEQFAGAGADFIYVLDRDGNFVNTNVAINLDQCYDIEMDFDANQQTIALTIDSSLVFTGQTTGEDIQRLDSQQIAGTENGFAGCDDDGCDAPLCLGGDVQMCVDDYEVTEIGGNIECDIYTNLDGSPGNDCEGNGICDLFELAGNDLNNNLRRDNCEGSEDDCNNNFILDSFEIAQGTALDANSNGIIDFCESLDHSEGFEDFAAGEVDAQNRGYSSLRDPGFNITTNAVGSFPVEGQKFLTVSAASTAAAYLFSPRLDAAGDADIETWQWAMQASSAEFGAIDFEVLDINVDGELVTGDGVFIFPAIYDRAANTGLRHIADADTGQIDILVLRGNEVQGDRDYLETSAVNINATVTDLNFFALRIANNRGLVEAFRSPTKGDLFDNEITITDANETQRVSTTGNGSTLFQGGDRQYLIRPDGDFGDLQDTEFYFDEIKYITAADCDNDGVSDADTIAAFPALDCNNDGIPDSCQDCDNDCGGVIGDLACNELAADCLDPQEISSENEQDCNNNGIPDNCDIDDTLPKLAFLDQPACCLTDPFGGGCIGNGCFDTDFGGGSCDADGNDIPDECQAGFGDCNGNGCDDAAEIANSNGLDLNNDGNIDACDPDCNNNGVSDTLDIAGMSQDAIPLPFGDDVPDECCPAGQTLGDMDGDGNIDAKDYQAVQLCAGDVAFSAQAGAGNADGPFCGCADLNGDGTVDEVDIQIFQALVTGP